MKLKINLRAELELPDSAAAVLQIEAPTVEGSQNVESAEVYISPHAVSEPFLDIYKNPCRRVRLAAGEVVVEYHATVEIPDARSPLVHPIDTDVMILPPDVLHYLLPSRYCQSDRMENIAHAEFGNTTPGFARVQAIASWINQHVKYEYNTSTTATTAFDTVAERTGVCRDFAHLGIALCRAMNIPARYVSGYCLDLDPPDFHAFFQAYLDGRWVTFDATEVQPRPALVVVAIGRDAVDCAWCSFFGAGTTTSLEVDVQEAE